MNNPKKYVLQIAAKIRTWPKHCRLITWTGMAIIILFLVFLVASTLYLACQYGKYDDKTKENMRILQAALEDFKKRALGNYPDNLKLTVGEAVKEWDLASTLNDSFSIAGVADDTVFTCQICTGGPALLPASFENYNKSKPVLIVSRTDPPQWSERCAGAVYYVPLKRIKYRLYREYKIYGAGQKRMLKWVLSFSDSTGSSDLEMRRIGQIRKIGKNGKRSGLDFLRNEIYKPDIHQLGEIGNAIIEIGKKNNDQSLMAEGEALKSVRELLHYMYPPPMIDISDTAGNNAKRRRIQEQKEKAINYLREYPDLLPRKLLELTQWSGIGRYEFSSIILDVIDRSWSIEALPYLEEIMTINLATCGCDYMFGPDHHQWTVIKHYWVRDEISKFLTRKTGKLYTYDDIDGTRRIGGESLLGSKLLAMEAGVEGDVVVKATIDSMGDVIYCEILESSQHAVLDSAALEMAKRYKFLPARSGKRFTPIHVKIPLAFKLPEMKKP